jgi:hypothetical protein
MIPGAGHLTTNVAFREGYRYVTKVEQNNKENNKGDVTLYSGFLSFANEAGNATPACSTGQSRALITG